MCAQRVLCKAAQSEALVRHPDLIHPIHDLDPLHCAPAGHERARERRIREADRKGIIHYA